MSGEFSLSRLRSRAAEAVRAGTATGRGRYVEFAVLQSLLTSAGMPTAAAQKTSAGFHRAAPKDAKGRVSFDRFFREYIKMQCAKVVAGLRSDPPKGTMVKRAVETRFESVFAPEDAREIVASVYRFLGVDPERGAGLTAAQVSRWFRDAYAGRRGKRSVKTAPTSNAKALLPPALPHGTEPKARDAAWRRHMASYVRGSGGPGTATLVIKGKRERARCGYSRDAVLAIARTGALFTTFDILGTRPEFREFWKREARFATWPQLWVHGELFGGYDVISEAVDDGDLVSQLRDLGVTFGSVDRKLVERLEAQKAVTIKGRGAKTGGGAATAPSCDDPDAPEVKHCEGGFADLSPLDAALVEIIAKEGVGDWKTKAAVLRKREGKFGSAEVSASGLKERWSALAPKVATKLAKNPEMPCGHTCGTCPERDACKLHDALEDMEDLVAHS